jgi:23S rRNA (uracil1939-C5)-methyltransferase
MTVITIERIAAGGEGVGRMPDGRVAFVSRTSPGDVVEVEEVQAKPRYVRARALEVKAPSPERVEPQCVHYTSERCGGCQLQHVSSEGQLRAKSRIVGDALRRIGGLDAEDPDVVPSPIAWRYRSKIRLTARHSRKGTLIGLHREDRPGVVFEPDDCLITSERVMGLWAKLREHRQLLPGDVQSVTLNEDREGRLHVIAGAAGEPWNGEPLVRALGETALSCWWEPAGGAARVVAGPETGFPALAFEQSNPDLAGTIRRDAVCGLGDLRGSLVWDLYGGVGDTAELLAQAGATVWSVDADRAAKEWARKTSRDGVHHLTGRVENVLHRLAEPDGVIVNPPRAGLAATVARHLDRWAETHPGGRMAYISCDPATLARDIGRMPALRVGRVMAYDLFPQTSHVETLALLEAGG